MTRMIRNSQGQWVVVGGPAPGPKGSDANYVMVNHGNDANVVRPDTEFVLWVGDVEPVNMANGDLWEEVFPNEGAELIKKDQIEANTSFNITAPTTNGGIATKSYVDNLTNSDFLPLSGGTMSGNIDFGSNKAVNLGAPTNNTDVATKEYVDNATPTLDLDIDTKTANYTFVLSDANKLIEMNSESSRTFTVPEDASVDFPIGTQINIIRINTGEVSVVGGGAATVNATPGLSLRAQWSSATLIKRAANSWVLIGDTSA